eukprot:gene40258-53206_t
MVGVTDGANLFLFHAEYFLALLLEADRLAAETGKGAVYGQLVVLGYKEYRVTGLTWIPMGISNEKLTLKR